MVAGSPVVGIVEGADGKAMGDRPGGEHVVELEVRVGWFLPVERAVERRGVWTDQR